MNDHSRICSDWTDRKLYDEVDAQIALSISAPSAGLRLGYLAGARALLGILTDRASRAAKHGDER